MQMRLKSPVRLQMTNDVITALNGTLPVELSARLHEVSETRNFIACHFWFDRAHLMFRADDIQRLVAELDSDARMCRCKKGVEPDIPIKIKIPVGSHLPGLMALIGCTDLVKKRFLPPSRQHRMHLVIKYRGVVFVLRANDFGQFGVCEILVGQSGLHPHQRVRVRTAHLADLL